MTERNDPAQAETDGRRYAKPNNAAPHYLRCTWYKENLRCLLAESHAGKHRYPEEKENEKT